MRRKGESAAWLWGALVGCCALLASSAAAQMPVPRAETPTLHGGTPINGSAIGGQIGYAALRADFFHGNGNWDVNVSVGAPTFGERWLHGYNQSLGLDVRVPFRIRLARWKRGNGSLKVGPYFHVGRAWDDGYCNGRDCRWVGACGGRRGRDCDDRFDRCVGGYCGDRGWNALSVGTGALVGFVADIALPKIFKLIVGVEQQIGLLHLGDRPADYSRNFMAGATWLDFGVEAFFRNSIFFTVVMNVGAQYGSDYLHYRDHALFRQLFGVAYKFR